MRTRPIYRPCDAAIRGHVFCSFLALVLQKELADRYRAAGVIVEWDDLIRDLDRLQEAAIEKDGKRVTTCSHPAVAPLAASPVPESGLERTSCGRPKVRTCFRERRVSP